jgi:predicted DNA-binding transcriptional regulator YafY
MTDKTAPEGCLTLALKILEDQSQNYFNENPSCIQVWYTNWRGERRQRQIQPIKLWFGTTEWHPRPTLFIKAVDLEKGLPRDFDLSEMELNELAHMTLNELMLDRDVDLDQVCAEIEEG